MPEYPRVDPQPMSKMTPARPISLMRKLGYDDYKSAKMAVRPFFYTCEELNSASETMPNSFQVPAAGVAVAAGATRRATIKMHAESDFEAVKLTCVGYTAAGADQNNFCMQLIQSGSDNQLMNFPIHTLVMTGTGQMPFILPCTLWITGSSQITIDFTLNVATRTYIYFALSGIKYYHDRLRNVTTRPMPAPEFGQPADM